MLSLAGVIRGKNRRTISGYSLFDTDKNRLIYVTKELGIQLCENGYIENAKVYMPASYTNGEKLLKLSNGNISDLQTIRLSNNSNVGLLEKLDVSSYKSVSTHRPYVVGCIFNQFGKIIGLRLVINNKIYNMTSAKVNNYINGNSYSKGVTDDFFDMNSHIYCADVRYMYGNKLIVGFKPLSVDMTPELANKIYHKNYILHIDIECDINLRRLVIESAREIEYNLFKYNTTYEYNLNELEIVASVTKYKCNDNKYKSQSYNYIVRTKDNKYLVVAYNTILDRDIPDNLPVVALWDREIKYKLPYRDDKKLYYDEINVTKLNKSLITKAIKERHLTLEQFMRDNTTLV